MCAVCAVTGSWVNMGIQEEHIFQRGKTWMVSSEALTHARTHTRTHACTHARMHARTRTHTHTHTHIHSLVVSRLDSPFVGKLQAQLHLG